MRCMYKFARTMLAGVIAGSLALAGCAGTTDGSTQTGSTTQEADGSSAEVLKGAEVDYGESKLYTQDDIDAAIKVVADEFGTWKGCTLKRIAFTDDDTCTLDVAYLNKLREGASASSDGAEEFDQAIVLKTDFRSPSAEDAEGTAWEPDTDYSGYEWHLGRSKGGAWHLMTWGYA